MDLLSTTIHNMNSQRIHTYIHTHLIKTSKHIHIRNERISIRFKNTFSVRQNKRYERDTSNFYIVYKELLLFY